MAGGAEPPSPSSAKAKPTSILLGLAMKAILCCCWPVHKCARVLSLFDTVLVIIAAYKAFNVLTDTIGEPHWTTVVAFIFFFLFAVCQVIASVALILAYKKQIARYCYPRIALLGGLVVCSAIAFVICMIYFCGATKAMNEFFFKLFEWFFDETLDEKERIELKYEMRYYGAAFTLLSAVFCMYSVFELLLTLKFHRSLDVFRPVPQSDPSAPHYQTSYNPDYGAPPTKMYPNVA